VNVLSLFSRNEELEEISSSNLRYLLLPAFMGELSLLQASDDRHTNVSRAKIYFIDYLQRCKDYSLTDLDLLPYGEEDSDAANKDHRNPASDRQAKINRYKQTKELKSNILKLDERLSSDVVDDDVLREYFLSWIRLWINEGVEKLSLINSELEILEHMKNLKLGRIKPEEKPLARKPVKPMLITKDSLKSKVFGAGYPSLPTITPEQWMDEQIASGRVVLDYNPNLNSLPPEKNSDEEGEETDKSLAEARAWDDWKDDHRKGEGNRKDRG